MKRVSDLLKKLDTFIEQKQPAPPVNAPEILTAVSLRDADKETYLSQPWQLFYSLEMAARLGIVRDLPWAGWMLTETEARQDADGFFRFDTAPPDKPLYFFPIEEIAPARYRNRIYFSRALHL